ncbi:MAG: hypothetical protein QG604_568 [Candidatus Dependentiae bacterium]|nr:hypothetical protein [Candidatus Dependentiae bacterium]
MMNEMQQKEPRLVCRVAILRTHDDPVHEAVALQLFRRLSFGNGEPSIYQPVVFQAAFRKDVVAAQLEKMVEQKCRILVVFGQVLSSIVFEIYREVGELMPTIYSGVAHPIESGFVDSFGWPTGNHAVITAKHPCSQEIAKKVHVFKKCIRRILLPYCDHGPIDSTAERARILKKYLEDDGFEVEAHKVASQYEVIQLIAAHLKNVGMVITLEGGCGAGAAEAISLCWRNKVVFCSGYGKQALECGAPCVYGGDYGLLADDLYEAVEMFCEQGISFRKIPLKVSEYERHFIVNEPLLLQMGVPQEIIEDLRESDDVEIVYWWIDKPRC